MDLAARQTTGCQLVPIRVYIKYCSAESFFFYLKRQNMLEFVVLHLLKEICLTIKETYSTSASVKAESFKIKISESNLAAFSV